jgi:hypothetical protein
MRRTLSDDRFHSKKKTSRFWWLPEWLWHGVVLGVIVGVIMLGLKKLASKVVDSLRGVKVRPIVTGIGRVLWKTSPTLALVLGFIFQKNVLAFAGLLTLPRIIAIIGSFIAAGLYFRFIAKDKLRSFQNATQLIGSRGWNIVIGGLSRALFDLAVGLLPFWQNPWIFVVLGLYSFLILDVVWMKQWFGRAARL